MTEPNAGQLVKTGGSALLASLVRTLVPWLIGVLVAAATKLGVPVNDDDVALVVNGLVSGGIALLYYVIARLLEEFRSSKWGWLLGYAKAPVYPTGRVAKDALYKRG